MCSCMGLHKYIFATTRIVGEEADHLRTYPKSKHVVVIRYGSFYVFDLLSSHTECVDEVQLLSNVRSIYEIPKPKTLPPALPALTADERTNWYRVRERFFSEGSSNKAALDIIESALFIISIEEKSEADTVATAKSAFAGNGYNRWFDKSFTIPSDAPVTAQMWEYACMKELDFLPSRNSVLASDQCPAKVKKLHIEYSPGLAAAAESSLQANLKLNANADLFVMEFTHFGKGRVKKLRLSPDGFVQMALQLAWYRDQKCFTMTYESAATRFFFNGRTDTIRPLSEDSAAFCRSMEDPSATHEEKIAFLKAGIKAQNAYARQASTGQACDRHLFGLYLISKGKNYKQAEGVLGKMLSHPFNLSTSQTPAGQMPQFWDENKCSAGGGFGAVTKEGYGVSYLVAGELKFQFHVSSWNECEKTSSARFAQVIELSMLDMAELFTSTNAT